MNSELISYVENSIIPQYSAFDSAHQESHVRAVIEESLRLAQFYDVDNDMVYAIAAYHDLGLCESRERHHIVSGEMLKQDEKLKQWFDESQLQTMSDAVEDHRASNKYEPRTIYGKIVAEADRQIDSAVTLRRTIQYGLKNYPDLDKEGQYARAIDHIGKKYAEGGYLKLYIPESANAERLAKFRELVSSPELFREVFDRLYAEEINKIG